MNFSEADFYEANRASLAEEYHWRWERRFRDVGMTTYLNKFVPKSTGAIERGLSRAAKPCVSSASISQAERSLS